MHPKYFKDKIIEELNAACDYLKKALDVAISHPTWAKKFVSMSEDRYNHVLYLYAMFMQLYKDSEDSDTYMNSIRDGIIDGISNTHQKMESYKMAYELLIGSSDSNEGG